MRVMVCDDDPDVGSLLLATFQLENWTAWLVTSGADLLAAVDPDEPPDAIVLDQQMPGMTGLQAAARLRDDGFARPIVLCSGHLGKQLTREIERLGLIPINKVDMDAVVRTVRAAVRESRRPLRRA
jgi:CheY-like chemotaxis protein